MDLYTFFRSATVIDLAWIILLLTLTPTVIIAAVVILFVARSRKPFFVVIALALLTMIVGLSGGAWRYVTLEIYQRHYPEASEEAFEGLRTETRQAFLMMTLLALPGTVIPLLVAFAGLARNKKRQES